MLTAAGVFYAAQGAVVGFVWWWWAPTYRAVDFVMEEWRPNEGDPYVAGKLAGSGEPMGLPGVEAGGRRVLKEAPGIAFEPGATVPIWHSPDAPLFAYNGEWTNAVPVAALPVRPGPGRVLSSALLSLVVAVVGLYATGWVRRRSMEVTGIPSGR